MLVIAALKNERIPFATSSAATRFWSGAPSGGIHIPAAGSSNAATAGAILSLRRLGVVRASPIAPRKTHSRIPATAAAHAITRATGYDCQMLTKTSWDRNRYSTAT